MIERIKVTGLGKAYKQYNSQWGRLAEWFIPFSRNRHKTNWVLQDINFSVRAGESVGIIGVNGAGKSTLLKMVTGTTQPTTGSIEVNGRVAALLELGMGFHPEFTGRQNVFMAGQLLGMNVNDISRLMPRIEEFAEIGDYIDQPVRVYSSGMQVRLAFSVATAVRPDLLIVDEAMSVGDIYFQQKCIARIEEFKNAGTSILFVTHDFSTLHTVCDRAILLANGRCQYIGKTIEAVERYFGYLNVNKAIIQEEKEISDRFIKIDKFVKSYLILNNNRKPVNCLESGNKYIFEFELTGLEQYNKPHIGFRIQDRLGQVIYETNTHCQHTDVENKNYSKVILSFDNILAPGEYTLGIGVEAGGYGDGLFEQVIALTERVMVFQVIENPNLHKWAGIANINPEIKIV